MRRLATALGWIGRQASPLFCIGVFLGVLVPPLAGLLQPLLLPAILLPFVVALLRLEPESLLGQVRRPGLALALVGWSLVGSPLLIAAIVAVLPIDPAIAALMVTTAACAPLMASPALAMLLGLDVALTLITVLIATALLPFTVPPLALWLAALEITLAAADFGLRLAAIVLGSALLAQWLRRLIGRPRLAAAAPVLDGLAVLGFVVFAVGVMDGFTATALRQPALVGWIVVVVFALNIGLQALTVVLCLPFATRRLALTTGLIAGNNNLGLVLASLVDAAPELMLVYVAAAQFPIYLLPVVQRRLYPRWLGTA